MQKIIKAVTSALTCLEEASDSKAESMEREINRLTWRAASDLEYALFLFSLMNPEETESSSWKLSQIRQPKIESLLASSKNLLRKAIERLEVGHCKDAQKKVWLARGQLLRINDFFWKKQRNIK